MTPGSSESRSVRRYRSADVETRPPQKWTKAVTPGQMGSPWQSGGRQFAWPCGWALYRLAQTLISDVFTRSRSPVPQLQVPAVARPATNASGKFTTKDDCLSCQSRGPNV